MSKIKVTVEIKHDSNIYELGLDACTICNYKVPIFKSGETKYRCSIFNKLLEEVTPFPELEFHKEYLRLKECIDSEVEE